MALLHAQSFPLLSTRCYSPRLWYRIHPLFSQESSPCLNIQLHLLLRNCNGHARLIDPARWQGSLLLPLSSLRAWPLRQFRLLISTLLHPLTWLLSPSRLLTSQSSIMCGCSYRRELCSAYDPTTYWLHPQYSQVHNWNVKLSLPSTHLQCASPSLCILQSAWHIVGESA